MRGNQGGSGGRVGGRGGIRELGILGAQIKRGRLHEMNHNILGDSRLLKLHTFTVSILGLTKYMVFITGEGSFILTA